ncbi:MAG: two-component sensor histidine kinase [Campylobacterales bacterium]
MNDQATPLPTDSNQELLTNLSTLIEQTYIIEQEYKEIKKSYDRLEHLFKGVLESLPNPIWVIESDGSLFLCNTPAKEIGLTPPNSFAQPGECTHAGHVYLVNISRLATQTIIQATDISEQKRRERLVAMGQVAAHLAHEIRNPIGSVSLLISSIFGKVDKNLRPVVYEMRRAIWRVERIIKATLLFSKGITLNKQRITLDKLTEMIDESIGYYTYTKDIHFITSLPPVPAELDPELIGMVLQNLIYNAIDAIEESDADEGTIELEYVERPTTHHFRLYDSGVPIKEPHRLFEPFMTTKTKGNGLGLALAKQIVESHHGTIRLTPGRKGFEIVLPKRPWEPLDEEFLLGQDH